MHHRRLSIAALLASSMFVAPFAWADNVPPTADGAKRVIAALQPYFGPLMNGDQPAIAVTPKGDGYALTFDLEAAAQPFAGMGVAIESAPIEQMLFEQTDGTWKLTADNDMSMTMTLPTGETTKVAFTGFKSEGIFDPKLMGFTKSTGTIAQVASDSTSPVVSNHQTYGPVTQSMESSAAGPDAVDAKMHSLRDNTVMHIEILSKQAGDTPAQPEAVIDASIAHQDANINLTALHSQKLLELLAFFVAHHTKADLAAHEGELRPLLHGLGSIFDKLDEQAAATDIKLSVSSGKLGKVVDMSIAKMEGGFDMTGLVQQGSLGITMKADGVSLSSSVLPNWAQDLIPSTFELPLRLSDYNLADASNEAIDDFTLQGDQPFTQSQLMMIGVNALPPGGFKVTLPTSHITSKLLDLETSGEFTIVFPKPKGSVTIKTHGLDAAIDTIQKTSQNDPQAAKVLQILTTAKSLAKTDPDGTSEWVLAYDQNGAFSVNGLVLHGPQP